jgi:NAD dependent epimerase/dehydratase
MKVLVTGADGFIGSHLVEALLEQGAQVRAFCFYNSFSSWGWLDGLSSDQKAGLDVFMGDIRDPHGVRKALEEIEIVLHLAALIGIPFSYHSPDAYVDTNVKGTLNVLQAARELKTKRVVVTSTSEVYGTAQYVPIDEKHPRQGQSPYSATKIGADALAESFYRSFNLPVVIARPFNTFGPRQSARAVIPTIIVQMMSGAKKIRLGALSPTRDLNYVKDTVSGFMALASTDNVVGKDVNIATQTEISVEGLFGKLRDLLGSDAAIDIDRDRLRPVKSEVERLLGSNQQIIRETGWRPQYSLDDGLKSTIAWFKEGENLKRYKSEIYNI